MKMAKRKKSRGQTIIITMRGQTMGTKKIEIDRIEKNFISTKLLIILCKKTFG